MDIILKIFGLSVVSFLMAAAILGFCMSGPIGILGAPIIALFGWFFFPLVFGGYMLAWVFWQDSRMPRFAYCLMLSVAAALLFSFIGPKEVGSIAQGVIGYSLGAFIPGFATLWIITSETMQLEQ